MKEATMRHEMVNTEDIKDTENMNEEERDMEGVVIRFEDRVMEVVGMKHNPRTGEIGFTWDADGFPYIVEFGMKMDEDGSFDLKTADVDITFDEFVDGFREWYEDNEDCYAEDDEIMYRIDGGEWVVLRDWEAVHFVRRKDASFEYHEEFSEDNLNAMDEDDRNSFLCDMADGCTSYPLVQDYPEDEVVHRYSSIDWGYAGTIRGAYTCSASCWEEAKDFMERVYGVWNFHREDEEHMRPEDRGFAGLVRYLAYTDREDLTCDWVWDDRCYESYDEATACAKALLEDEDVERTYVSVMLYWGGDEDQWQEDTCYTYTADYEE